MLSRHTRLRLQREDAGTGAGSRGGHVIGKTSSGKPIYASHGHPEHAGFSSRDHDRAANLHANASFTHRQTHEKHLEDGKYAEATKSLGAAHHHEMQAHLHAMSSRAKPATVTATVNGKTQSATVSADHPLHSSVLKHLGSK